MKTRALAAVLTLTMILSACSGGRAAALAEETAAFYAGLTRFSAEAEVTLDHGDSVSVYTLTHEYAGGVHTLTVTSPPGLAGLVFTADGDSLELRFAGAVFAPRSLEGTGATPMKLLPDALRALGGGLFDGVTLSDGCLTLNAWSRTDGDEFAHRIALDPETRLPLSDEIFLRGRMVMRTVYRSASAESAAERP